MKRLQLVTVKPAILDFNESNLPAANYLLLLVSRLGDNVILCVNILKESIESPILFSLRIYAYPLLAMTFISKFFKY